MVDVRGCRALIDGAEWFASGGIAFFASRRTAEHCLSAMVLTILEAFAADEEPRARLARFLLAAQLPDGGWNCDERAHHGSFNTTTLALAALQARARVPAVATALTRGRELLLAHRLCCSHRTGRVVRSSFTRLRLPVGWETDVLSQLDHFVLADAPRDSRLEAALDRIQRRRRADGRWLAARPQPGALHFPLEPAGAPSRWVTLRCLRALQWWAGGGPPRSRDPGRVRRP